MTPAKTSMAPTSRQPPSCSPNSQRPSKAEKRAWQENSRPLRLGPSRFMQANRAVSPTKMPISPDSASRGRALWVRVCQPPVARLAEPSIRLTSNMRQRL